MSYVKACADIFRFISTLAKSIASRVRLPVAAGTLTYSLRLSSYQPDHNLVKNQCVSERQGKSHPLCLYRLGILTFNVYLFPRLNLSRDRFNLGLYDTLKDQIGKRYKMVKMVFVSFF